MGYLFILIDLWIADRSPYYSVCTLWYNVHCSVHTRYSCLWCTQKFDCIFSKIGTKNLAYDELIFKFVILFNGD